MEIFLAITLGAVVGVVASRIVDMVETYVALYKQGLVMASEIEKSASVEAQAEYMKYYKSLDPMKQGSPVMARNENVVVVSFLNRQKIKMQAQGLKVADPIGEVKQEPVRPQLSLVVNNSTVDVVRDEDSEFGEAARSVPKGAMICLMT